MEEKVYQVTVVLDIHGQASKRAAQEFLEEALHCDGLLTNKIGPVQLLKAEPK